MFHIMIHVITHFCDIQLIYIPMISFVVYVLFMKYLLKHFMKVYLFKCMLLKNLLSVYGSFVNVLCFF